MMTLSLRDSRAWRMSLALLVCAAGALAAGCEVDIPQDPVPETRVVPVFDPATATIPLPNNAALDPDGTLPDLPDVGQDTAAGVFADYTTGICPR